MNVFGERLYFTFFVINNSYKHMNLFIFDLDGTLAKSKQRVTPEIIAMLERLSNDHHVVIISGAGFDQFHEQLLSQLGSGVKKENVFILPTSGSQLYVVDGTGWRRVYANFFTQEESDKIVTVIKHHTSRLMAPGVTDQIEHRGSQITFSALGQRAKLEDKLKWDPSGKKKAYFRNLIAQDLPEFEVRTGGSTSIDVTKKGIDKAWGIQTLLSSMLHEYADTYNRMMFFGDALQEHGNDSSIKRLQAIECIAVTGPEDTLAKVLEKFG